MVETLSRLFVNGCLTSRKASILPSKREGRTVPTSAAEFEARVRSLSAGVCALCLRSSDSKSLAS